MDTAAELFLLLTNDEGGPASWGTQTGWALSAATIADLLLDQRVWLNEGEDPRLEVIDATPTGQPVLDMVLARAVEKEGTKLSTLVQDSKMNPEPEVVAELARLGVVDVVPKRLLGLVPEKRPTVDPGPEREIRQRLRAVLIGGQPSASDATLLAILQGLGVAKKVLAGESEGMSTKQLQRRVEEASREVPVGEALKRAIDSLNAAIIAAVVIPAAVAGGSS
ncbi:MAG TPA: GPP34 family phosphoprotein [Ornithinimicrobium sp.]|uniref:GOLPH3/VPS74 family protein n=1 Tax=Ornithinimicrobium sp. TaxID=1977084 RepID=UPI002B46D21F|nr:GPP34 family phosphoprotein [Ornithinimicrobium sp.]HKJ12414.1 GPP34 family phosphoprotein [Ornithinimicrobium sp.]